MEEKECDKSEPSVDEIWSFIKETRGEGFFHSFHRKCSHAIPSRQILDLIKAFVDQDTVLSIGSGLGLWEWLMMNYADLKVIPTSRSGDGYETGRKLVPWSVDVESMDAEDAVKAHIECGVLFICWPSNGFDYAYRALNSFSGDKVVFIGEWYDGCCATKSFFDLLDSDYHQVDCRDTLKCESEFTLRESWDFEPFCSIHRMEQHRYLHDEIYLFDRKKSGK